MNRRVAQLTHHTLADRIVAIVVAWLITATTIPAGGLSLTETGGLGRPMLHTVFASLPAAIPRTEEPAPAPTPDPPDDTRDADKWGEITVGQPKIWQYERVNSLLDGLLRDVQGVSMSDLIGLDPNATNGAAVKFVQSMLEIGVKHDQGAAVTNSIALQNFAASQSVASAQIEANKTYLQQLYVQRTNITNQMAAAMQLNTTLQGQLSATDPTTTAYQSLTTQQKAAASQVTSLQSDLSSINSQITAASSTTLPAAPSLASTSAGNPPESASTFSSFLGNLPSDLTKNLVSQLQSPSYPATKRLDNFITLLYERLAREISVLQDDVMRDPENVPFLVQFDVGLYPSSRAKNHVGVVEFTMDCEGCKVYSIYPGQSSYNLANYEGASKRYTFWGNLLTLVGLGVTADYRRQTDTLHGDLVQSVCMSGFQEGAPRNDRAGNKTSPTTQQRFGWYYGASPFETEVTPGVRSTFAIISIPRQTIKACLDPALPQSKTPVPCPGMGIRRRDTDLTRDLELNVTAHSDWVMRDDPYSQKPHWYKSKKYVERPDRLAVTSELLVNLPGSDAIQITPDIVLAERERLHVLGMEYNPVYFPTSKEFKPEASTTPNPGTTEANATGTGSGTANVSISAVGIVSASSTGVGGSMAKATATVPPAPPPSGAGGTPQTDTFTGCKQYECAAVLIKLAEPIDPNLQVTVRGVPLRRIRDWRGRATSILPPAQSASDMPSPPAGAAGAAGQSVRSENASGSALLEGEKLGPDTWMEVDSHRLLLNISKALAGSDAFPSIQIIDPAKRALFIPIDLDEGFSEIIMNDFHLPILNQRLVTKYIGTRFLGSGTLRPPQGVSLRPSGPYAYETYLPLFLPTRDPQKIDAYLGESGVQILVELVPDSTDGATPRQTYEHTWLPSRVQVILEDSFLDFAWSLSCYVQGPDLVCDVPWQQIQNTYRIVQAICPPPTSCPSITSASTEYPSISSLQVWVEQYDPEYKNSFYTPTPARLGRYPVAMSPSAQSPDVGFSPWHFESANQTYVRLEGCQYPNFPPVSGRVQILGQHIPPDVRTWELGWDQTTGCWVFNIPTVALTHPEVVIEYSPNNTIPPPLPPNIATPPVPRTNSNPCLTIAVQCTPESLTTGRFRPYFGKPRIIPHSALGGKLVTSSWTIEIPVGRADCNDALDLANFKSILTPRWKIGATPPIQLGDPGNDGSRACPTSPNWQQDSKTGQVRLAFEVTRNFLPMLLGNRQIHLIRGMDQTEVATMPDFVPLLLPTKLTITGISPNQFELLGPQAELIEEVTLQGPGGELKPPPTVATGPGVALVSLVQPPKSPPQPAAPPPKAPAAGGANPPPTPAAGTYTVLPLLSWTDPSGRQQFMPLEVTDPQGKPLTYTIADKTQNKTPDEANATQIGPATTITITKKTTQTAPPAKAPATTPPK